MAHHMEQSNEEIKNIYNKVKADIENQKKGEKKVFKSFFRNVNKSFQETAEETEPLNKKKDEELGKPQLKFLTMYILII
jgi:hypothetical protein